MIRRVRVHAVCGPYSAYSDDGGGASAGSYRSLEGVESEACVPLCLKCVQIPNAQCSNLPGDEIEEKHAALAAKELSDLERDHPGATERRKECEARRQLVKEHEMKLVHDRHEMTEPGMRTGKIPGWADQQKARREHMHAFDLEMEALEKKLNAVNAK